MSAWLPIGGVPPELRDARWLRWLRRPDGALRATLLLGLVDVAATCRHLRRHPDPPDVRPRADASPEPRAALPLPALHPAPTTPDPRGGVYPVTDALAELACPAAPVADIETSMGTLRCALRPELAPAAVATFVGLARGRRDFWDPTADAWTRRPFYDGTVFHAVRAGRWIQAGDPLRGGDGDPGVRVADENTAPHDRAGLLCLVDRDPGASRGQFAVFALPAPEYDGRYSILGRCAPAALVDAISEVAAANGAPRTPVVVRRVRIGCDR